MVQFRVQEIPEWSEPELNPELFNLNFQVVVGHCLCDYLPFLTLTLALPPILGQFFSFTSVYL
jgi:hypothetical protein